MKKIDQVRKALIAAGYARIHALQHEQGAQCTSAERWMHFSKLGEDTRPPLLLWHVRAPGYEEVDVSASVTQEDTLQALVSAIAGAQA